MSLTDQEVADLVGLALRAVAAGDEDGRWQVVTHLHGEGGQPALDAARELCGHEQAAHRELGADILSQVGGSKGPLRYAAVRALLDTARDEQDPAVLRAIAVALGHRADARAIPVFARLRSHPAAEVRDAVAFGLLDLPERAANDILIALSADPESGVRHWATFGLARMTDADFPELRDALAARAGDADLDTRVEAIHGLATRRDPRALPALLDSLTVLDAADGDVDGNLVDEALFVLVASTGDPRLCPHVEARRVAWLADCPYEELPTDLRAAMARCAAVSPAG
ncbi:HEAT repeat domain-containing protein [Luedemannella flava]